ncbi:MAG: NAD-dependent epimerase/dehydratase family protein [Pseudomonadota bacterium]
MSSEPTYLVTGAAGFVGSHVVRHFKAQGQRVRAMVRREPQAKTLEGLADEVVIGDLTDPASLTVGVQGVAGIHHVARCSVPASGGSGGR